jgi:tetratricopeptide (TPR) repeat protein
LRLSFLLLSLALSLRAAQADSLDARGIALLAQGKYREAAETLTLSIAADPKGARAFANRCTARYKLGDYQGAIDDFTAAVALSPRLKASLSASMSDAHYRRALLLAEQGRGEEAASDLYAAVRLDRRNAAAYAELGYHAVRKKQYETALSYLDRAISLNGRLAPAYASRAVAGFALGRGGPAREDARRAVALDPALAGGLDDLLR